MTRTINRRTALASTAALAAICPLPLQAAETDAEIARLYTAYLEAEKRDAEAYAAYDEASGDARSKTSPPPILLWPTVRLPTGLHSQVPDFDRPVMDRQAIEDLVAQFPAHEQSEERTKRLQALEEWQAERAKHRVAYRVDELKAASDKAQEERYELWDQLAQTPAKSVTGIALKLVALFQWDDGLQDAWSGKSDPEYSEIMCLAARADALRLAGMPHTFGTVEPEGEYVDTGQDGA